uniref:NADH-ubiquinone oxidoreductase chain 5 n=1 Tax=Aradacanthia heissi TaxID=928818 RepID=I6LNM9_9HEMI|nr:NADH dehydrogenase subunit 5 [Aradacanthia heissi]
MICYLLWSFYLFILGMLSFLLGCLLFELNYSIFFDWEFISLGCLSLSFSLFFDSMSFMFSGSVMMISSMVILYSHSYMYNDLYKSRFLYLVLLFILSMLFLIFSPNMVSLLLGWDGLGLVSYCLVVYFYNFSSYNAGMLTLLINRIGDAAILISLGYMSDLGGWFINFHCFNSDYLMLIFYLIVLASFTKSAQIPFSSWLPAAMAAPTPVSALVHSSTLVTAGVYLLIRFNDFVFFGNTFLVTISVFTMFMSGLGANFEYDLKKVIALSTLSQLGMMMSILMMGCSVLSFYHLLTHAFFKALLFLCAGVIIHCMNDSQDIRFMCSVVNFIPFTSLCFCISSLSLGGFVFLSGFYSKDFILEFMGSNYFNFFIILIYYVSVGLTMMYSLRLVYFCMSGNNTGFTYMSFFESGYMNFSMIFMLLVSIISGSLLSWLLLPQFFYLEVPFSLKLLPLIFVSLGGFMGYAISFLFYGYFNSYQYLKSFLGMMWFMPDLSTILFYPYGYYLSKSFVKSMDIGWFELSISSNWLIYFSFLGKIFTLFENNNIKLFLLVFLVVMLIYLV